MLSESVCCLLENGKFVFTKGVIEVQIKAVWCIEEIRLVPRIDVD